MPLDLVMMVASVGLQFFNNYANNRKARDIQQRQHEFQNAVAIHDFDRMRKAQAEAAKIALELEAEVHKERIKDIEDNYNSLLNSFAHSFAIRNWPLNVLPFIMKGESFSAIGSSSTSQSINMHCILTPSNSEWFNECLYDDLDMRVEVEMNNHWNSQSSHPIVYYGGGWNRRRRRNGKDIPDLINLNDILLLKNYLEKIPTMVITPYFDPCLSFKVQIWGMGADQEPFRIDIPNGDIDESQRIFSYDYYKEKTNQLNQEFYDKTLKEFVPYITSLIGFVADKYFWCMYGYKPSLPEIAQQNTETNRFFKEQVLPNYKQTLSNNLLCKNDFVRAVDFVDGISCAISSSEKSEIFTNLYEAYVNAQGGQDGLTPLDLKFLRHLQQHLDGGLVSDLVADNIATIQANEDMCVWFCANKNELFQRIINETVKFLYAPSRFVIEWRNDFYAVGCFVNDNVQEPEYSEDCIAYYIILLANANAKQQTILDIATMQEASFNCNDLFNSIIIDEKQFYDYFDLQNSWLQSLCEMTEKAYPLIKDQLKDAPIINFGYQNLKDWIEDNAVEAGEVKVFMGFLQETGRYFYIVNGHTLPNSMACFCNTIDDSMRDKFRNKTILTIKLN